MMDKGEIKTFQGKIKNINNRKIIRRKLYKRAAVTVSSVSLSALILLNLGGCGKKEISPVPENQTKTTITVEVETGDTLSEIADKYYNDNCEGVYNSFSNYENAIKEQNDMNKFDSHIEKGDKLEIPVIVNSDNTYYLQIIEIKNMITELETNNLWVRYVVQPGDSFSKLASLASGDYFESYELISKIASKNGMRSVDTLNDGREIWIMNPELGKLKSELKNAEEQLKQSLTESQIKK